MPEGYDLRTARDRIQRIFRYLQEMHSVRTPPVVHLDAREWRLVLDTLPDTPHIQRGYRLMDDDGSGSSAEGTREFVIKVGRPRESECPEPSVVIKNWLEDGWDQVGANCESIVKKSRRGSGSSTESFEDSDDRVDALAAWLDEKKAWENEERESIDGLAVFSELFELHARVSRESEKYQLFLADGILVMDHPSGPVSHPVLLQRIELKFDSGLPEFAIVPSEDPEVYTPLLRHLGLDGDTIRSLADAVAKEHVHPLGDEATGRFFKDFVHRFWEDGQYFETDLEVESPAGPYLYRQPQLYLGYRNYGLVENIERYVDALAGFEELPESLVRVVGIETGRSAQRADDAAPIDLLLTKHANAEQEQVIRRLAETGAVIVQGPPGTGKSHTIANLIGHLLAEHKSILVTSHASKALRVVREKLARPLQSLCVSVLDSDEESNRQLEESITGIVNYLSTTSEKKLAEEIERLKEAREGLTREHDDLRDRLLEAVQGEYRELEVLGESVTPSEAARKVVELVGTDDWIPGPLSHPHELPLSDAELEELYELNAKLVADDEKFFDSSYPDLDALPTHREFAGHYDEISELEKTKLKTGAEFWIHEDQTPEAMQELLNGMKRAAEILSEEQAAQILEDDAEWIRECLEAGRAGGDRAGSWHELVDLIETCARDVSEREPLVLEHGPVVESDKSPIVLIATCRAILEHLEAGKQLSKLTLLRKSEWSDLIRCSRVDDGTPTEAVHFRAILSQLEVREARDRLAQRWDRQIAPLGLPTFAELGHSPEKEALRRGRGIALALDWHSRVWSECEAKLEDVGLDWTRLSRKMAGRRSAKTELQRTRELIRDQLEPLIETRSRFVRWRNLGREKERWLADLDATPRKDGVYPLVKQLRSAIKKGNYDTYTAARDKLAELIELQPCFDRRRELLEKLAPVAPGWADAIRERHEPHVREDLPGDVEDAWRYRYWEQQLAEQARLDLDRLQEKLAGVTDRLIGTTADYVEKLSWMAQLRRTGLEQQQALQGWLGLHKKIGKGTGKNVPRLREEAKRTLVECRNAVPVWIMPLSRVVESFDLATTRFDVVIIDEASQSDVMGLVAFALGKEVVVVGDHEQVSPYAVGQRGDRIHALIDEILTDVPNKHLYDGKTSVYDLARQSFGGTIRLIEHFRCVPDIIQFSNELCYGGEIRALRESTASRVSPPLVARRVQDGHDVNGINKNEALEIASLVSAVCRLDEYDDCTIGVISLVGTDQALYIDSILRRRLTVSEYQKRRILCGNASQFQGDERDIIFLSIVNSPSGRPLMLRQREDAKKVFNVAASRARDQLWVVHSLDPGRDLKHGDLRLRLISHAENPEALRPKPIEEKKRFNSDLEKLVFRGLSGEGYRITSQYQVGEYTIDLVVDGERGDRVAIQCDGDRSRTTEELADDMGRQMTLERLGWEFVRVRGSEFFRTPEQVTKRLVRRLAELDIHPVGAEKAGGKAAAAEALDAKVRKRAEQIRARWKDIPTVTSFRRKAVTRPETSEEAEDGDGVEEG
ncbi:MAG: AAA domain-containing protein [Myxococcota bacterium]